MHIIVAVLIISALLFICPPAKADELMEEYLSMQVAANTQLKDKKSMMDVTLIGLGACSIYNYEGQKHCKESQLKLDTLSKDIQEIKSKKSQLRLDGMKQFKGTALRNFMGRWEDNERAYLASLPDR